MHIGYRTFIKRKVRKELTEIFALERLAVIVDAPQVYSKLFAQIIGQMITEHGRGSLSFFIFVLRPRDTLTSLPKREHQPLSKCDDGSKSANFWLVSTGIGWLHLFSLKHHNALKATANNLACDETDGRTRQVFNWYDLYLYQYGDAKPVHEDDDYEVQGTCWQGGDLDNGLRDSDS
jgi:hypothetical protein